MTTPVTPETGPPEAPADRYRAPALDRGLDILEVLADQARGLTRAEIVKALGLGPSQIYRMLERDRKSKRLNSSHSGESRMPSSA